MSRELSRRAFKKKFRKKLLRQENFLGTRLSPDLIKNK